MRAESTWLDVIRYPHFYLGVVGRDFWAILKRRLGNQTAFFVSGGPAAASGDAYGNDIGATLKRASSSIGNHDKERHERHRRS